MLIHGQYINLFRQVKLGSNNVDDNNSINNNNNTDNSNESSDNSGSNLTIDFSESLWLVNFIDFMSLLKSSVSKESKHVEQHNK